MSEDQSTRPVMDDEDQALFDLDAETFMVLYDARNNVGIPLSYEEAERIALQNIRSYKEADTKRQEAGK